MPTPSSEQMRQFTDKWIDFILHSGKDLTLQEVEDDIEWMYNLIRLPKPDIGIFDSQEDQMTAIQSANLVLPLYNHVSNRMWHNMRGKIEPLVSATIWSEIVTEIANRSVKEIVTDVRDRITRELPMDKNHLWKDEDRGPVSEYWLAAYEFFRTLGMINDSMFERYLDFCKKGMWSIRYFKNCVFICKLPTRVEKDDRGRLHSTQHGAVAWRDGREHHFIRGVSFTEGLWTKVVNKELTVKEVLTLENIEQRMIALSIFGADELLEKCGAKLINTSKRGTELYSIHGLIRPENWGERWDVKLLKYKDPSTDRVYTSFVPFDIDTADAGMAWKFQVSAPEYEKLIIEA